jgi:hypothetical protein
MASPPSSVSAPSSSRYIPSAVRRAVHERDGSQCSYRDASGRRCSSRERLEFHHRRPFAMGGEHDVGNVTLVCRAHNAFLAEVDYGRATMSRHAIRTRRARAEPAAFATGSSIRMKQSRL